MEQFIEFIAAIGDFMPDLLSFILCPALLLIVGAMLALFHKEKAYVLLSVGLGALGFFLVLCEEALPGAGSFCYLALYTILAVLIRLLFLIPFRTKKSSADELFEKFNVPLDVPEGQAETEGEIAEEESGLRLDHAASLIERLEKCALSASDRLEVVSLSRTLEGFRNRALTADEMRSVNDCLSTILKLTAKYKL